MLSGDLNTNENEIIIDDEAFKDICEEMDLELDLKPKRLYDYYLVLEKKKLTENVSEIRLMKKPKINEVRMRSDKNEFFINLEGIWSQCNFTPNSTVFVSCSNFNKIKGRFVITSEIKNITSQNTMEQIMNNFIIFEPEIVISATQIKGSLYCSRASIFSEEITLVNYGETTLLSIIGDIIHEVFEKIFSQKKFSLTETNTILAEVVNKNLFRVAKVTEQTGEEITDEGFLAQCKNFTGNINKFYSTYLSSQKYIGDEFKITDYLASEKTFYSEVLGLKGITDILVEINDRINGTFKSPFEIKTGQKAVSTDSIQVIIYCLLLTLHYNQNINKGTLCYLKDFDVQSIKVQYREVIHLLVIRNNVCYDILKYEKENILESSGFSIDKSICQRCFKKQLCKDYMELYEDYGNSTIDSDVREYFKKYYDLMAKEQKSDIYSENKVFSDRFSQKVDISEYISYNITKVIDKGYSFIVEVTQKNTESKTNMTFDRWVHYLLYLPDFEEPINALLIERKEKTFSIVFNVLRFQTTEKIYKFFLDLALIYAKNNSVQKEIFIKCQSDAKKNKKYIYKLIKGNLVKLCANPLKDELIKNLQDLIIHFKTPTFNCDMDLNVQLLKFIKDNYNQEFESLNINQKKALLKSLLCNDYSLIMGYPGSGKTTFISLLIRILHQRGNSVLVTAYTNTAVDNLLLKLRNKNVKFYRIASRLDSVHKDIHPYIFQTDMFNTIHNWNQFFSQKLIFASTTSSIGNIALSGITFDYVIADEACQILEPHLLGPLLISKKFILVGDPNQLSGLLKSKDIDIQVPSLFQRLKEKHPNACTELIIQYRMNNDILKLSNECVYSHAMKCGSQEVEKGLLKVNFQALKQIVTDKDIIEILNPEKAVIFVDYNQSVKDKSILENFTDSNTIECDIIENIISGLLSVAYNLDNIGIISPYISQEATLKKRLKKFNFYNVYTIDKSQGIEKDVIIISFVKTNNKTKLLQDEARINVAFTRAKVKLILIGLVDALKGIKELNNYLDIIERNGWIYYLKKNEEIPLTM